MVLKIAVIAVLAGIFFPAHAYAYIDPGTGSLVLQALIAGGITALVFLRNVRDRIFSFFRRDKDKKENK